MCGESILWIPCQIDSALWIPHYAFRAARSRVNGATDSVAYRESIRKRVKHRSYAEYESSPHSVHCSRWRGDFLFGINSGFILHTFILHDCTSNHGDSYRMRKHARIYQKRCPPKWRTTRWASVMGMLIRAVRLGRITRESMMSKDHRGEHLGERTLLTRFKVILVLVQSTRHQVIR